MVFRDHWLGLIHLIVWCWKPVQKCTGFMLSCVPIAPSRRVVIKKVIGIKKERRHKHLSFNTYRNATNHSENLKGSLWNMYKIQIMVFLRLCQCQKWIVRRRCDTVAFLHHLFVTKATSKYVFFAPYVKSRGANYQIMHIMTLILRNYVSSQLKHAHSRLCA